MGELPIKKSAQLVLPMHAARYRFAKLCRVARADKIFREYLPRVKR